MLADKNNLRSSLLDSTKGEARERRGTHRAINKIMSQMQAAVVTKVADELVIREVFIEPTKWNKTKLFIANFYETFLIILGLALSIYVNDVSSFVFQILM